MTGGEPETSRREPDALAKFEGVMLGPGVYDITELAAAAGVSLHNAEAFWRAFGFPDAPGAGAVFTDLDLATLRGVAGLAREGVLDRQVIVQLTRAIGQALSRVAESEVEALSERVRANASGSETLEELESLIVTIAAHYLPGVEQYITYGWRRHLVVALTRELGAGRTTPEDQGSRLVGFADLVGFTAFTQEAESRQLAAVIDRFENLAYDRVSAGGGRVIKMIGDEVFFAVDEPRAGADIGIDLAVAYHRDDELPLEARVGLAYGPVLTRGGDLFGPPVNLASRLVNLARPGSVLVTSPLVDLLAGYQDLEIKPLRRLRALKGIGRVPLHTLRRV